MQKIILSPPFSNLKILSNYNKTSRIIGTYTLKPRPGLYKVLTTLRRTPTGWFNNVGLRNPGIHKVGSGIVSIAELESGDYGLMMGLLASKKDVIGVEFNISCPNAGVLGVTSEVLEKANKLFKYVIIKIPHEISDYSLMKLLGMGSFIVHVSNTKSVKGGAISGLELIERNLSTIKKIKILEPNRVIIGGGGIYSLDVLYKYMDAGADHFSLSTILINPYKSYKLINSFYEDLSEY